ncbi:MAG TPA: protein kinase [Terriglobia bacterium]|nr:protein kinase [Terriglobia bacterium]
MTLQAGAKLGPYEVLAPLGEGGMGEVYRARDTKLGRDVALKVLPQDLAGDADRLARFRREAQVLASLNYPNIAAIYGLEESAGVRALVMELVEGPTLAERLSAPPSAITGHSRASGNPGVASGEAAMRTSPLQLDEALHIAKQIAEALEYAHERGVIHRDLKPANVKVTPDGTVKVLDFGLAKLADDTVTSADPSSSPTLTAQATQVGMIMGTAAYMAPEQARGQTADRRADVWSFGAVLFEMLSGRRAFDGETTSDVLAAVLKFDPEWTVLPASTPASIVRLIHRCLTKDRKQRLQAIGEARIVIDETQADAVEAGPGVALAAAQQSAPQPQSRRHPLPWLIITSLTLIIGIAAGWWTRERRMPPSPNWSAEMLGGPSDAVGPRISPDGHTLAFQAGLDSSPQVAVMDSQSGDWTFLTKDRPSGTITELNWSPDGSKIYFDRFVSAPKGIYTVSRFGGDEHLVLEDAMAPEPLPDGSLLAIRVNRDRNKQLYRFWPEGGRLEALDALTAGWGSISPVRAFRDGKEAVFLGETLEQARTGVSVASGSSSAPPQLYIIDLASGKARRLAPELDFPLSAIDLFPIAIASDDQSVLVESLAGDLHRVISIPRHGTGPIQTLFSLTLGSDYMDVDKDGDIYLDQLSRPLELVRFPAAGGTPETLSSSEGGAGRGSVTVPLVDGRVVFASLVAGRSRLLAVKSGGEAVPLIETKEETSLPACQAGKGEIAFVLGSPGHAVIAIASLADGRIVNRLAGTPGSDVTSLAASPEGETLYYVVSGTVWAIAASGGQPRQIGPGDSVVADANGKNLIVQLIDKEGVRLLRVPVSGGAEQPIPIVSDLPLAPVQLSPNAIGKDGRVLLSVAAPGFVGAGFLDPRSGKLEKIPLTFTGDVLAPGWLGDGRVLSGAWPFRSALWRFRPEANRSK